MYYILHHAGAFFICHHTLQILKDATLYFSRSTPNLATVIPAMDHIDEKLTSYSRNKKYAALIRAAVRLAKRTLNRYYELTDSSEVYRIAMGVYFCLNLAYVLIVFQVLHPRHKLSYFKAARWEEDWIHTAEKLVRDTFDGSYLSADDVSDVGSIEELSGKEAEDAVCFFFQFLSRSCARTE